MELFTPFFSGQLLNSILCVTLGAYWLLFCKKSIHPNGSIFHWCGNFFLPVSALCDQHHLYQ